ncbi:MAG: hypothetical protein ABII74_06090 [Elusimicrobiota bacterium]
MRRFTVLLSIAVFILNPAVWGASKDPQYKDVSPELKQVIKDFDSRGVLSKFTGKYGDVYYRPTSNISREDLVLALYEYDQVVKNLLEAQRQLVKKISDLQTRLAGLEKSGVSSTGDQSTDVNVVVEMVQSKLPEMIEKTPSMKKVTGEMSSIKNKVELLKMPTEDMIAAILKDSGEVSKALNKIVTESLSNYSGKSNLDEDEIVSKLSRSPVVANLIQSQIKNGIEEAKKSNQQRSSKNVPEAPSEEAIVKALNNSPQVAKMLKTYIKETTDAILAKQGAERSMSRPNLPQLETMERTKNLTKLSIALSMLAVIFMAR